MRHRAPPRQARLGVPAKYAKASGRSLPTPFRGSSPSGWSALLCQVPNLPRSKRSHQKILRLKHPIEPGKIGRAKLPLHGGCRSPKRAGICRQNIGRLPRKTSRGKQGKATRQTAIAMPKKSTRTARFRQSSTRTGKRNQRCPRAIPQTPPNSQEKEFLSGNPHSLPPPEFYPNRPSLFPSRRKVLFWKGLRYGFQGSFFESFGCQESVGLRAHERGKCGLRWKFHGFEEVMCTYLTKTRGISSQIPVFRSRAS